jgi:hypothetical protein
MIDKELFDETRKHLSEYPMRKKNLDDVINAQKEDTLELKREWVSFKKHATNILIGGLGAMVAYGIWVGTIQSSIQYNATQLTQTQIKVNDIDRRQQASDVSNAEIKTKLNNIESTLLEIKTTLKNN